MDISVTPAQCARLALMMAQGSPSSSLLYLEPCGHRDWLAVRDPGASTPCAYIDRDGLSYSRLPFTLTAS